MDNDFQGEPLPEASGRCFGCGPENPSGIKLRFVKKGPLTLSARFTPPEDWTGWGQIANSPLDLWVSSKNHSIDIL